MRALVKRGNAVAVEERPIPQADPTEVVVRTTSAALCSADVACVTAEFSVPDGIVLGHESVGVVHEVGERVRGFAVGQRVTSHAVTACGRCENCQSGLGGHCQGTVWGGYKAGISRDGFAAEYFVVPDPEFSLVRVPTAVTDANAVCVSCAMATGFTGPELANAPLGATVAVFGQGHVGLSAIVGARLKGAGLVIGVRAHQGDSTVARRFGADHVLNFDDGDPVGTILELTGGEGVDLAIEATGDRASFPNAVKVTRLGGTICILSSYAGDPDAELRLALADYGWGLADKTIFGPMSAPGRPRLSRLVRLLANGRADLAPLITHEYGFADVERAFADLRDRRDGIIKPLIKF
jgi:threonine dehydrogenase-like Zn-dependent dehydrogenase